MYRIKISKNLGLPITQVEVKAETQEEAYRWISKQLEAWGVPMEKINESLEFEKLELLLETPSRT